MTHFCAGLLRFVALLPMLLAVTAAASDWTATADGITVYLGVVPAEVARASLTPHVGPVAKDAHGRPLESAETHHFVVAIFESSTGKRIEDAQVSGNLIVVGKHQRGKQLEPMRINNTISYGNAFDVSAGDEHRFDVEIRVPGRERPTTVSFSYWDPHGNLR